MEGIKLYYCSPIKNKKELRTVRKVSALGKKKISIVEFFYEKRVSEVKQQVISSVYCISKNMEKQQMNLGNLTIFAPSVIKMRLS